jgi:hypothetical protein
LSETLFVNGRGTLKGPKDAGKLNFVSSTFGQSVREVERSHQHVVIEETATWGAALGFGVPAVATFVMWREILGISIALFLAAIALYAGVTSEFVADRNRRCLIVKRRLAFWSVEKAYEAQSIERIYVRHTGKGSALAVRFRSGKTPNLTMSLGFDYPKLEGAAAALNHFLPCTPRRRLDTPDEKADEND